MSRHWGEMSAGQKAEFTQVFRDLIERNYVQYLGLTQALRLSQPKFMEQFRRNGLCDLRLRIGIAAGPVVAGIIGLKKFSYDLWGDTVNVASRMESFGIPGEIQATREVYHLLRHKYLFEQRGLIEVKGKGQMLVYLLRQRREAEGPSADYPASASGRVGPSDRDGRNPSRISRRR